MPFAMPSFDKLDVKNKARVIAAICAVAGVIMGFVIYVVFAHTFEQGEVSTRLAALAVGLAVAMGVARLGEWLWETIATGGTEERTQGKKAFSTAVFLIVVFELCASTVEDFAKIAIGGEFDAIQRISARVAGVDGGQTRIDAKADDLPALLERLRAHVRAKGLPGEWEGSPATTPEGRLIQSFTLADRLTIFGGDVEPTPAQFDALFAAPPRYRGLLTAYDVNRLVPEPECQPSDPKPFGVTLDDVVVTDPLERARRAVEIDRVKTERNRSCAAALAAIDQQQRIARLLWAANVALGRSDFFAVQAFPDAKPPATVAESPQRHIRSANLNLLRQVFPDAIAPARVLWGDFAILIAVWCAAAVALSLFLTQGVFEIPVHGDVFDRFVPVAKAAAMALAAAALAMGLAVVAVRVGGFAWAMMFGEAPQLYEFQGILSVLNIVPWAVREISGLNLFGWHLPAWIVLPGVIGVLVWIAASDNGTGDNVFSVIAFWALAGIVIVSVLPVLPGVLGLMLIVGVTWVVPTLGLAVLLPYLEPGARVPRLWGVIALAVGLGLGIWAALRFATADPLSEAVLIATAVFLLVTGVLVFRENAVKDLWPLLTVTVAFCLVGGTSLWQDATFKGALNQLHPLVERQVKQEPALFDYVVYGVPRVEPAPEAAKPSPQAKPMDDGDVNEAARLELALVGSLGFWLTIALLAAWSLRRKHEGLATAEQTVKASDHAL
jgi:uncharacterized membrane protein YuzA (DUF378 family)